MVAGTTIGAIAMTEPDAGSDLRAITCSATRDGDSYILNGNKTFVTNGATADLVIVAAKTKGGDPRRLTLFVVETATDGLERGRPLKKIGQHAADTAEISLRDVRIPASSRLGAEDGGLPILMQQLPQERLILGVNAVVQTEKAIDLTREYVNQRVVLGKPLIAMQNTRFVLAECATQATVARVFLDDCVARHADGGIDPTRAAMAKWWLSEIQCDVVDRCLQFFGGYGYMEEYPIARMYADARVQKIYGGSNEVMKELIGRSLTDGREN
jgi:acyl-CoA dehydrogenase